MPTGSRVDALFAPTPSIRERALASGVERLSDGELVALLLGTGRAGQRVDCLAYELLEQAGGLRQLESLGPGRLAQYPGVGASKATRVAAAIELGKRCLLEGLVRPGQSFACFEQVAAWARPRLAGLLHEEVWLLSLDVQRALKRARRVGQGGAHGCALLPPDVLRPALMDGASALVLIHNHPSGDPTPSPADVEMTQALCQACELVGLVLLDHVVVAARGACSLRDFGALDEPEATSCRRSVSDVASPPRGRPSACGGLRRPPQPRR